MRGVNRRDTRHMTKPIFLDNHSTTPLDPGVFEQMRPWFLEDFGNPHSTDHSYGWKAEAAVEAARREVAALIGARPAEIIFTSGATESNNLALSGVAALLPGERRHIVSSAIEHPCVAGVVDRLEAEGFAVTRLWPGRDGQIRPAQLAAALRPETGLVSILSAHHEFGAIQPIAELAAHARRAGAVFHTDAAQAAGKIPTHVGSAEEGIDLLSLSAHKLYGPKGIGALYMRRREGLRLRPLMAGGGQQNGLRPGTVATPLAVGFGAAAALAGQQLSGDAARLTGLRDRLLAGLQASVDGVEVNGALSHRLPQNLNLRIAGIAAVDLIYACREAIAISAGSACASAVIEPSPALLALGLTEAEALASIRIGLGRATSEAEVDTAVRVLADAISRLRQL